MEYFNKFRSTVTQVAAQVSNALPGNPLFREYEVGEQIASAGPGLHWKIYKATKRSSKQVVSLWVFDKKDIDKWSKDDKELFMTTIKRGVSQLTRLRHPRLLIIEHALEEARDSLAFATELVFASLANCLGDCTNLNTKPEELSEFSFLDIEIRHGLMQIGEALSFLHVDAKLLHRNVNPGSIIINDKGAWKLGGFDFAVSGTPQGNSKALTFEMPPYDPRVISLCQPLLDYMAPEFVMDGPVEQSSDIFSLGCVCFAIFNKGKSPIQSKDSIDKYKRIAEKIIPQQYCIGIPQVFAEDFKMCLNMTPGLRPDAIQFTKIVYFDDPLVKTLNCFESLMQMDNNSKMQFFKSLPAALGRFEKRPLLQKVLPCICSEFGTADLIPFILPSVFLIAEQTTKAEFARFLFPLLVPVFSIERPYQIALLLLQKMELFLEKAPESEIKLHVLPLIYTSLMSETTRIQELCLSIVPTIGKLVDRNSMKTQLLPKLLKLATDGGMLAIRVQALVCLGKLLPNLESWMVTEQILPALPKIPSKEPGVLMAMLGIYKLSFESENASISREQLAKSALPFLMATSVENTLNLHQFEQFMALIHAMMRRVEQEQRSRLEKLSAGQEDQRGAPNLNEVLTAKPASIQGLGFDLTPTASDVSAVQSKTGALSLEEKKKLAAEQSKTGGTGGKVAMAGTAAPKIAPPSNNLNSLMNTATTSKDSSNSSSFDFFAPLAPSSTAPKPTQSKQPFDISEFLPTSSKPAAPTLAQLSATNPLSTASTPAFNTPFSSFGAFPQPPPSANSAIQRNSASLNALMGGIEAKKPTTTMNKDPFADLLG